MANPYVCASVAWQSDRDTLVGGWSGLQAQAAASDTQLSLMPRNMWAPNSHREATNSLLWGTWDTVLIQT